MTDFGTYASSLGQLLAEAERLRSAASRLLVDSALAQNEDLESLPADARELGELMMKFREAMLKNPLGASRIIEFLVAEGREYAETEEGAIWQDAILGSPHLEDLRALWEATTLDIFNQHEEGDAVPAGWVDLLVDVLSRRSDVDALIDMLRPGTLR